VKPGTYEHFATSGASGEPVAASGRTKWRGLVEARAGSRLAIQRTAVYGLGTLSADREGAGLAQMSELELSRCLNRRDPRA
jgi:hypothetical protein